MASKTLTITKEAYDALCRVKRPKESFSKLFLRLTGEKRRVESFLGVLKGDVKDVRKRTKGIRAAASADMERRIENVRARHKRSS